MHKTSQQSRAEVSILRRIKSDDAQTENVHKMLHASEGEQGISGRGCSDGTAITMCHFCLTINK